MKNNYLYFLGTIVFFFILSGAIFLQFFIKHLYPYPGNFMLAWFEPWKTTYLSNGVITLAHKPVADDIFRQIYPFRTLAMDMIKRHEIPLWNPYNGAGMPLFATMNIGFLDPFNIFYFFLSDKLAWTYAIILQPILIAFCMFIYCKKVLLRKASALFSTMIFLFSGVVITRLIYGMFGLSFAMLPLSLYCIESFIESKKKKIIWLLPFTIYFSVISTQPQIACYILFFIAGYIFFRKIQRIITKRELLFLYLLSFLGIGLASLQLFPTFELLHFANVNQSSSQFIFSRFLVPLSHFITLVIPNYFGNIGTYNYWEPITDYIETTMYIGTIPLLFAWYALSYSENKKSLRGYLVFVIAICFVTCLQSPFATFFFRIPLPIISTGIPTRIFLLSTFAISLLAGFGFDAFYSKKSTIHAFGIKILPIILIILGIFIYTIYLKISHYPCPSTQFPNCRSIALRNTLVEIIPFVGITLLLVYYILRQNTDKYRFFLQTLTILIIVTLGLYNSQKYQPFSLSESFLPFNPLVQEIQLRTGINRIFGFNSATIQTDFATLFRFYDPEYYHPLYIKRYGELVSYSNTGIYPPPLQRSDVNIINNATISASMNQRRQRLFDLLGVKYFIYKKSENSIVSQPIWENTQWIIGQNNSSLPRAYLVNSVKVVTSDEHILKNLFSSSFDPTHTAIIEQHPSQKLSSNIDNFHNSVVVTHYTENLISLTAKSNQAAFLVFSDNDYPGWQATIDGKRTQIYRANYTFRGVFVPKGSHSILFSYQPFSFFLGLIFSGIFLFLLIVLFVWKQINYHFNNDIIGSSNLQKL